MTEHTLAWDYDVDYVVLGAGSAGCVLADRLSESGQYRVLLVEAGPPDRNPFIHVPAGFLHLIDNPAVSWRYRSEPIAEASGRRIDYPQGKMFGGTSSMNGMLYVRSARAEHAQWVKQGCPGWSFDEVLPFYQKLENVDGADPSHRMPVSSFAEVHSLSKAFLEACGEAGFARRSTVNGRDREGAAPFHQTREGRFRRGAAQTYLRAARKRANLQILSETLARRILFDETLAIGAEVQRGDKTLRIRARREVILSCGSVRSPHVLQLSGVGPWHAVYPGITWWVHAVWVAMRTPSSTPDFVSEAYRG